MFSEQPKKEKRIPEEEFVSLAKQPANNPKSFEDLNSYAHYALTPIEHDYPGRTPTMWNAVYKQFDMDVVMAMVIGDPEITKELVKALKEDPKYIGGGTGVGFKDQVIKYLDELDPVAQAVGSINVVKKMPDGLLRGYNTDGIGYLQSLTPLIEKEGKKDISDMKIVMLGAGGTGNSVAFALAEAVREVVILNRSVEKAKDLANRINQYIGRDICRASGEDSILNEVSTADVVVNVSTKGSAGDLENYSSLAPAKLPANEENIKQNETDAEKVISTIPKGTIISDIILRKGDTPLLAAAKKHGFVTLDGLPMVINQGVESFWLLHEEEMKRLGIKKEEVAKIIKEVTI